MSIAIVWFRQDLRCSDNPALAAACNHHQVVIPLYIKDDESMPLGGAQKWWLHHSLQSLAQELKKHGLPLCLRRGNAFALLSQVISQHHVDAVYWNRCYEPQVIQRDQQIKTALKEQDVEVLSFNGSLLHEPWTVKNKSGHYFKVFTPFWRQCLRQTIIPAPARIDVNPGALRVASEELDDWRLRPTKPDWAGEFSQHWQPGEYGAQQRLSDFIDYHLQGYKALRDLPAIPATSRLSPHLHFGEISPWQIWRAIEQAKQERHCDLPSADHFLAEMGWREFSYHLLYHYPSLPDSNFKREFDAFSWQHDDAALKRWQQGMTGYPIVDAGMRELWRTGYMHNRVRMIVASFLTKDLLIDWRIGAAWFMDTLLDADLANNSASWQWVAGSGADASPYFRIFNPVLQGKKFDPDGDYVRRWVPELAGVANKWLHKPWEAAPGTLGLTLDKDYPGPMLDHKTARHRALDSYQTVRNKATKTCD